MIIRNLELKTSRRSLASVSLLLSHYWNTLLTFVVFFLCVVMFMLQKKIMQKDT